MLQALEAAARTLGVALRPMTDDDLPFSADLYASIRAEELAQTGWPIAAQRAFLDSQHAAQHAHYRQHYAAATRLIIERDGVAVGRLYLFEGASDVRIVDIALMPAARGGGIGGALLDTIRASAAGKTVSIHVERANPARRLYERQGFRVVDAERGPYDLMEWRAAGAS
jgi:ribosomal protein S18 acetylase RimI-like enzyme